MITSKNYIKLDKIKKLRNFFTGFSKRVVSKLSKNVSWATMHF